MPRLIDAFEFSRLRSTLPVVDVRSPKEYAHGHVPNAINLPVFSDDERAVVGTLHKKKGKDEANIKALSYVEPKKEAMLVQVKEISAATDNELLVHCWRGGLRSKKFSEFLVKNGFKVNMLKGGYKAYRNAIHDSFRRPWKIVILGGMTGTGKTEILQELKKRGHQTICLESLAKHRGSAFGRLGQEGQPTTEQFQNNLWEAWSGLDFSRPVLIEDESQAIGSVRIPDELFVAMRTSPVVNVLLDIEKRADRLVVEYGKFDVKALKKSVMSIARRLGQQRADQAALDLDSGKFREVAISTLRYYDKAYTFGLDKREKSTITNVEVSTGDASRNASTIEEHITAIVLRTWKK